MAEIAETYMHLRSFPMPSNIDDIGNEIFEQAVPLAKSIYEIPLDISIQINEGSLKAWIGITTTLATIVSAYGGLRSGVDYLRDDAKEIGNAYIALMESKLNPSSKQIFRTERRTKTIGKLYRIYKRLDWLKEHEKDINADIYSDEMADINRIMSNLLRTLDEADVNTVLSEVRDKLDDTKKVSEQPLDINRDRMRQLIFLPEILPDLHESHIVFLRREKIPN